MSLKATFLDSHRAFLMLPINLWGQITLFETKNYFLPKKRKVNLNLGPNSGASLFTKWSRSLGAFLQKFMQEFSLGVKFLL